MVATKHARRLVLAASASLALSGAAIAQTADQTPPAKEDVCSGFSGRAYGMCTAFCEAQDCDTKAQDTPSCQNLRRGFERATGSSTFPCEGAVPTATGTDTPTPTNTPEPTATDTAAPPPTDTPTGTPTGTAAATATDTPEPTATDTPLPPTDTPTGTPTGTAAGTIG
jgi:hypothetical protein